MTIPGTDYAFGPHPSIAVLKAAGIRFAGRYVSPLAENDANGKNLLPAEKDELLAAGIAIILFAEQDAQRMLGGRPAGVADAQHFDAVVKALGMPGAVMFCSADFDAAPGQQAALSDYLDGAASVLGGVHRIGIYGGFYVVSRCLDAGKAAYACQTYAWSGTTADYPPVPHGVKVQVDGGWFWYDERAQIRQGPQADIGGVACDSDTAWVADFGQWPRPAIAPPPVPPVHRAQLIQAAAWVLRAAAELPA